jgi:2-polyprenyl-3-methyl-5-hydroxy-6-metoxy-1,4-benzoquinol methylase
MCGESTNEHAIIGHRLSRSQGMNPRGKKGITTTIARCNNCRLIYPNPQPVPYSIQDHYDVPPESYWKPEYFVLDPHYFSHELQRVAGLTPFKKGMTALDIGAGLGKCMLALQAFGFESYGIEPSKSFYNKAIEGMGINPGRLKLGMIEEVEYEDEFFDFITFGAVLEHLYNPAVSLEGAMKWLKPGGLMHIEVPSADYLISKVINLYYTLTGTSYVTNTSPMHEPYHLYEFTYRSFEKLAERTKMFEIVFHEYFACSAAPFPKIMRPLIERVMGWTNTGMQLSIWLKKT